MDGGTLRDMTVVAAGSAPKTRKLSISSEERAGRVERVREELGNRGLDALVVFHPERIGYLISFVFVSTERPMALVVPVRGRARDAHSTARAGAREQVAGDCRHTGVSGVPVRAGRAASDAVPERSA